MDDRALYFKAILQLLNTEVYQEVILDFALFSTKQSFIWARLDSRSRLDLFYFTSFLNCRPADIDIEVCLRATIVFRFGLWACLGYLRLSAWWLRFQPVFLWGCTPLAFNLNRLSTRQ